jgi:hypothetical protein
MQRKQADGLLKLLFSGCVCGTGAGGSATPDKRDWPGGGSAPTRQIWAGVTP